MFGAAAQYLNFVDCTYSNKCAEKGITGYPTWSDGEKLLTPGIVQLDKLAELSECKY